MEPTLPGNLDDCNQVASGVCRVLPGRLPRSYEHVFFRNEEVEARA